MAQTVPPDDQLTTLYKASQGFANSNSAYEVEQETFVSRPNILADRIFLNKVPDSAPTALSEDITWGVPGSSAARYVSSMYWIVKYTGVPLTPFAGNPDETFYFGSAMNGSSIPAGTNLLANMLLPLMISTAAPTYRITVTNATGSTIIPPSNYILDRYAGIITIYPGNGVSSTAPPLISFWRYEGPTLRDVNLESDMSGNLTLTGNVTTTAMLTSSNILVENLNAQQLLVTGQASINGLTAITESLQVTNDISSNTMNTNIMSVIDHIDVGNGDSTIAGNLSIDQVLSASSAEIHGTIIVDATITAAGNITTGGSLAATGLITANSGITVPSGSLIVTNNIAAGTATVTGTLTTGVITAGGLITANSGLTVGAGSSLSAMGPVTASSLITANSGITVGAGSTLLTTGPVITNAPITVNAGADIAGGILTTGKITASDTITANSGLTVGSGSTLSATGPITATGGLITANSGLTVGSGSTLSATGPITATGGLITANSGLTVGSGSTLSATGPITSTGLISANGGLTVVGTLNAPTVGNGGTTTVNGTLVAPTIGTAGNTTIANSFLNVGGYGATDYLRIEGASGSAGYCSVYPTGGSAPRINLGNATNHTVNIPGTLLAPTIGNVGTTTTVNGTLVAPTIGNGGSTTVNGTLVGIPQILLQSTGSSNVVYFNGSDLGSSPNNTVDLGAPLYKWKTLYVSTIGNGNTTTVNGTLVAPTIGTAGNTTSVNSFLNVGGYSPSNPYLSLLGAGGSAGSCSIRPSGGDNPALLLGSSPSYSDTLTITQSGSRVVTVNGTLNAPTIKGAYIEGTSSVGIAAAPGYTNIQVGSPNAYSTLVNGALQVTGTLTAPNIKGSYIEGTTSVSIAAAPGFTNIQVGSPNAYSTLVNGDLQVTGLNRSTLSLSSRGGLCDQSIYTAGGSLSQTYYMPQYYKVWLVNVSAGFQVPTSFATTAGRVGVFSETSSIKYINANTDASYPYLGNRWSVPFNATFIVELNAAGSIVIQSYDATPLGVCRADFIGLA